MEILIAILLGIVQGITEWFPISSNGHLVIVQSLFHVMQPVSYDLALHLGSLVVICFFFRKDLAHLIRGLVQKEKKAWKLLWYLILGSIPIAIVGYFLQKWVESTFNSLLVVGIGLLFTSVLLYLSRYPKKKDQKLTSKKAFIIGVFQGVAILPGVSRSGSTISVGMMQGVDKEESGTFSFLLFIPAILGATVLEFHKLTTDLQFIPTLIGVCVAMLVGYFTLFLLMRLIHQGKFHWFSVYCAIVGVLAIILHFLL